jgi:broad specificity phosphatase PhoE
MAISLVYETHSITLDNEAGVATGWLPGELSPAGRGGARELGARRRDDGLDRVVTSDLARAVETAAIAFAGSSIPVTRDARLRECNYGESMCDLVEAPFAWQPGWELVVPEGFRSSFVR